MSEYLFKNDISKDMAHLKGINPELHQVWRTYHDGVFKDGALSKAEKELIAVAGAHITGDPYSIRSRVRSAKNSGATDEQIVESIYGAQSEAALRTSIDKYVQPAQDADIAPAIRAYQGGDI